MRALLAILAVLLLPVVAPAHADCEPTTTDPAFCPFERCVPVDLAGAYYVDEDDCSLTTQLTYSCHGQIWVYEESNGMPGLQRRDEYYDDTCGGRIEGDTPIY